MEACAGGGDREKARGALGRFYPCWLFWMLDIFA